MLNIKLQLTKETIYYFRWKKCIYYKNNNSISKQPKECLDLYDKYLKIKKNDIKF